MMLLMTFRMCKILLKSQCSDIVHNGVVLISTLLWKIMVSLNYIENTKQDQALNPV